MDVRGCEKVPQGAIPSVLPALTYICTSEGAVTNARVPTASEDVEVFNLMYLQGVKKGMDACRELRKIAISMLTLY